MVIQSQKDSSGVNPYQIPYEKNVNLHPEEYTINIFHSDHHYYDNFISRFNLNDEFIYADDYQSGFNLFRNYLNISSNDLTVADTLKSISRLNILLGSKREQLLFLDHQQNLGRKFGFNFSYNSATSPGFISEQFATYRAFDLGVRFLTNRYQASLQYNYHKVESKESGGIVDSLVIDGLSKSDILALPVKLSDADNKIRRHNVSFSQSIFLVKNYSLDSALNSFAVKTFSSYDQKGWVYSDAGISDYYKNIYFDSTATFDSSFVKEFKNQASLVFDYHQQKSIVSGLVLSAGFSRHDIEQKITIATSNVNYTSAIAEADLSIAGFKINADLDYVLEGNQKKNDYSVELNLQKRIHSFWISEINFSWNTNSISPGAVIQHYVSNHFIWENNSFEKEKINQIKGDITLFKNMLALTGSVSSYTNKLYFNNEALPAQVNREVKVIKSGVKLNKDIYKFNIYGELNWQNADNDIIRIPDFECFARLSYKNQFFKSALKAEVGMSVIYFTGYKALDFMPATGQLFLQNKTSIGNDPCFNLFANLGIGTATLYLKLEQVNYNIFGDPYFAGPGYPSPSRTLKFGVKWLLKN